MIRRLIAPLAVAIVTLHAGQGFAQGAFPAPLPGQTGAANASPFPLVNGAAPAPSFGAAASPAARRGREARQDDQGGQRSACRSGPGLQADRKFQRVRTQDDQIRRESFREMRDSTADRRSAEEGPQEHRDHAAKGLRGGAANAKAGTHRTESERCAGFCDGASGGYRRQEGRYLRYAERQRPPAMTAASDLSEARKQDAGPR